MHADNKMKTYSSAYMYKLNLVLPLFQGFFFIMNHYQLIL